MQQKMPMETSRRQPFWVRWTFFWGISGNGGKGEERIKQLRSFMVQENLKVFSLWASTITPARFQDSFWCCWCPSFVSVVNSPFLQPSCIFFWWCPVLHLLLLPRLQHWTSVLFHPSTFLFNLTIEPSVHQAFLVVKPHLQMIYWLIHNSLLNVSRLLPFHLLSWPASLIVLFAIKKEANDGFVRRLTLANLQESSCFHSPHSFEEHNHHLHGRCSQLQTLQR